MKGEWNVLCVFQISMLTMLMFGMCRCWDNLESRLWWIIKTPILLSIFVSTQLLHLNKTHEETLTLTVSSEQLVGLNIIQTGNSLVCDVIHRWTSWSSWTSVGSSLRSQRPHAWTKMSHTCTGTSPYTHLLSLYLSVFDLRLLSSAAGDSSDPPCSSSLCSAFTTWCLHCFQNMSASGLDSALN